MGTAMRESAPLNANPITNREQLRLALDQGEAYQHALEKTAIRLADNSQQQRVQDYAITYAIGPAQGSYELADNDLYWREPRSENIYLQIAVCDAIDQRFIPDLTIYATLINSARAIVGVRRQPFVWHPALYHYGSNWRVLQDGMYTLKVRLEAPAFSRRDKDVGRRYLEPVEVEFHRVLIDTGHH
ncbi:MAG TPA: hypothetical protein VLG46_16785 [Anaerolineae bacterium]|nr:hypothetical protein [Anaerolineae bacterium]